MTQLPVRANRKAQPECTQLHWIRYYWQALGIHPPAIVRYSLEDFWFVFEPNGRWTEQLETPSLITRETPG